MSDHASRVANVRVLRDELGQLAANVSSSIRRYAKTALGMPAPTNVCNAARMAEYDALALDASRDEEVATAEERLADGVITTAALAALDALPQDQCAESDDLVTSVYRFCRELSCQRKWVMKKVKDMVREAHYSSWMRQCCGARRRGRTAVIA